MSNEKPSLSDILKIEQAIDELMTALGASQEEINEELENLRKARH